MKPPRSSDPSPRLRSTAARAVLAAALLAGCAPPDATEPDGIRVAVEQFTLPNGLQVVLHRDTTSPIIATNIWYHVGSANERPGRTGFAHLFEHIMFEGSKNVPEGKIDEWFEEVGGGPNGSTSNDRTNYFQTFSSNALDMALFIESDRMGWLLDAMSPASVDGQRDVVKNERRQSYDNRPYGLASQILGERLFPEDHPYHWPVIGYMDDLSAAGYEDVVDFFRTYYTPNNASLVVAGDIDAVEARRLVEKWFGEIPRGPEVPPLEPSAPRHTEPDHVLLEDRVQLPRIVMTWVTPAAYADDEAELLAFGRILGDGKNSRLFKRLVYDMQIADDVSAFQSSGRLASQFRISATARTGHDLAELERVILEELEALRSTPPESGELTRVMNQMEVGFYERLERVDAKANQLNEYLFLTGDADYFQQDLDRILALTPEGVTAAAERHLDPNARNVLSIVPQGRLELAVPGSELIARDNLAQSPRAR
ncbi:MAG: pitrilysin family protein [Gemmatimonadota bacterium]|jgi:zinc protease